MPTRALMIFAMVAVAMGFAAISRPSTAALRASAQPFDSARYARFAQGDTAALRAFAVRFGFAHGDTAVAALRANGVRAFLRRQGSPAVVFPVITTTQTFHNDMNVYGVNGPLDVRPDALTLTFDETITGLMEPSGEVTSALGHVFVTEETAADVKVFSYTSSNFMVTNTLMDPGEVPFDVASSPSEKLVAVSNSMTTSSGNGSVSVYLGGAKNPTSILTVKAKAIGVGIALDHKQNCFWSYDTTSSGPGTIVEFVHCKGAPKTIVSTLTAAGGLAFDRGNNLFYVDQAAGKVFRCNGTIACTPLVSAPHLNVPFFIHFDRNWKHLWLTDPGNGSPSETPTIYALNPKTGKAQSTTPAHGGIPSYGIAPDPGSKF